MTTVDRRIYPAVGLLSGAALAHELLLLRLFSIAHWPGVAHMVISLALLGGGVSGTLIALTGDRLVSNFRLAFPSCSVLFGLSAVACTSVALHLPLNADELAWDGGQWALLGACYILLATPFLCAATGVGLALMRARERPGPVYAADLIGAGLGCLAALLVLQTVFPGRALALIGALGLLCGALALRVLRTGTIGMFWALVVFAAVLAWAPEAALEPRSSEFKPLAQLLRIPGAEILAKRSGPDALVTAVASERIPLRHAPGMTIGAGHEPPLQIAVFRDGSDMQAVSRATEPGDLQFLEAAPAMLPYRLRAGGKTLLLNAGTGEEAHRALLAGADSLSLQVAQPGVVQLMRGELAGHSGHLFRRAELQVFVSGPRQLPRNGSRYDLIVRALPPPGTATGGTTPDYSQTVEAVNAYLDRLGEAGLLVFNTWLDLPPRSTLRLLSTAARALQARGIPRPGDHIAMFRGWQTAILIVSPTPFHDDAAVLLRQAAADLSLDAVHYPGVREQETNRHHPLANDWFRRGAVAILSADAEGFAEEYPFRIDPVTDARPYPAHDSRWDTFFNALSLRDAGGLALASTGLLTLLATLFQASLLGLLLVILPMALASRTRAGFAAGLPRLSTAAYFSAIGIGFMFVEIVAIQRAILLIGQPTDAAAIVIAGFLVFAGLGAVLSGRLLRMRGPYPLTGVALVIVLTGGLVSIVTEAVLPTALAWPLWARVATTLVLNAPMAFVLGIPFPAGLALLARSAPSLRPWAWGINGCASVIGAILAALTTVELGLDVATMAAMLLYPLAAITRLE